ncbi:MAG: hypothetical protein IJP05_05975 [Oscillospiraceae bacterium]|nr:hypothetical protein [Oscillospiraceae bacterium]
MLIRQLAAREHLAPYQQRKDLDFMFSNISFNDYRCQLESRLPSEANWAKHEKMAYCEGFSALVAEKKSVNPTKTLMTLILSIVK